jgi:hypothetical protein
MTYFTHSQLNYTPDELSSFMDALTANALSWYCPSEILR